MSYKLFFCVALVVMALVGIKVYNANHEGGLSVAKNGPKNMGKVGTLSTTDPASAWVIVNKKHTISPSYAPKSLVNPNIPLRLAADQDEMKVDSRMSAALESLVAAANQQGLHLRLESGYRSYDAQSQLYNYYLSTLGQAETERSSAKPGTSEHQTGLAADLGRTDGECAVQTCFADTNEGKWLGQHAADYGFIIRYPNGKESVTGYEYEPWHVRFVGTDLAKKLSASRQTMEEYFKVSG